MAAPSTIAKELKARADRAGAMIPEAMHQGPWSLIYSFDKSVSLHLFTAKVRPGRGTVAADWELIGTLAGLLGAPESALLTDIGEAWTPDQTIRWMWTTPE